MENVDNVKKDNKLLKGIKKAGNGIVGISEMAAGAVLTIGSMVVPATAIAGIPLLVDGSLRAKDIVVNTDKTGSLITSIPNWKGKNVNRISQDANSLVDLLKPIGIRDKKTFLLMQELNFLLNSNNKDKDGNPITFNTQSQGVTKSALESAETAGLIENFTSQKVGKRTFVKEKFMMGNFKNLFHKNMGYEMNFNITNQKVSDEQIMEFLKLDSLDENKFNIKRDEDGNITSINFKQSYAWKDTFQSIGKNISSKMPWNKNKALPSADVKEVSESNLEQAPEISQEEKIEENSIAMYKSEVYPPEAVTEKDVAREEENQLSAQIESQEVSKSEVDEGIIE